MKAEDMIIKALHQSITRMGEGLSKEDGREEILYIYALGMVDAFSRVFDIENRGEMIQKAQDIVKECMNNEHD